VGTDYYQQGASADLVYNLGAGRESHLTPFLVAGLGAVHDEFWPMSRDGIAVAANAGVGLVSPPLFKNGLRLRLEARYVYDAKESSHGEPRVSLGIEVPIGHVQHVVEYRTVKEIEVHETVREVPRPRDDTDDTQTRCPGTPPEMRVQADSCALAKQTVELRGVTFEFNKARLMPNAETVLDVVAQAFIDQPGLQVEVAGHTDSIGSVATNLALSQRRAEAVRNYLIKHGARPDSLTARGYGKSHLLIHPETGEQDRERNRRVELSVVAVQ
jgi:OOP family OmpA-OmpF porin